MVANVVKLNLSCYKEVDIDEFQVLLSQDKEYMVWDRVDEVVEV